MTEQEQLFKNTFLSIYQLIPFKMRVEKWIADEYLKNLLKTNNNDIFISLNFLMDFTSAPLFFTLENGETYHFLISLLDIFESENKTVLDKEEISRYVCKYVTTELDSNISLLQITSLYNFMMKLGIKEDITSFKDTMISAINKLNICVIDESSYAEHSFLFPLNLIENIILFYDNIIEMKDIYAILTKEESFQLLDTLIERINLNSLKNKNEFIEEYKCYILENEKTIVNSFSKKSNCHSIFHELNNYFIERITDADIIKIWFDYVNNL